MISYLEYCNSLLIFPPSKLSAPNLIFNVVVMICQKLKYDPVTPPVNILQWLPMPFSHEKPSMIWFFPAIGLYGNNSLIRA